MCVDPITAAVVSIGATALSTGLGIAGQAQQAAAQQAMYGYQVQVARNNQITADRLAVDALTAQGRLGN
jgi:predicted Zn-dependent protease